MRLPEMWARCDWCYENAPEVSGHPPEDVLWDERSQKWMCSDCWEEVESLYEGDVPPLVWAGDVMLNKDEQADRLIAAAAKRRMGVK
jgi:hypothetical protein